MAGKLFSTGYDVDPLTGMPLQQIGWDNPRNPDAQKALAYQVADMSPTPNLDYRQPAAQEGDGFLSSMLSDLGKAKMPTGSQLFGTEASRKASPLQKFKDFGYSDKGQLMAGSISDMMKRIQMQPVLETEALFKAFNRPGNLTEGTEKGILGSDLISDVAEANMLEKKRQQDERRQNLIDRMLEAHTSKLEKDIKG